MKALLHPRTESQLAAMVGAETRAYIFHGPAGVGKFTAARRLARQLNCLGDDHGVCPHCRQFEAGSYPDYTVVAPEDKASITIEQVRRLIGSLGLSLYYPGGQRIIVIDEAQRLTVEAQNALLKLIEEPPERTRLIFVTTSLEALLPTVRSRCGGIYFPSLSPRRLKAWLGAEVGVKPSQASAIVAAADGAPGIALRLLASEEAMERAVAVEQLVDRALAPGLFERLLLARQLADAKADLDGFGLRLHQRLAARLTGGDAPAEEVAVQLSSLERFRRALAANVGARVALERLMLEL